MTRDRLDYTKRSFAQLAETAGCEYDHYVFDNGSTDGTQDWLRNEYAPKWITLRPDNHGICVPANELVETAQALGEINSQPYDVYVRFDNDCEIERHGTLERVCRWADAFGAIIAPKVHGLLNPPGIISETVLGGEVVEETGILGGVFMAIPRVVFDQGYRFPEDGPKWGGDEGVVPWWRDRGGIAGYLRDWPVHHRTEQHNTEYPEYYARKVIEVGR